MRKTNKCLPVQNRSLFVLKSKMDKNKAKEIMMLLIKIAKEQKTLEIYEDGNDIRLKGIIKVPKSLVKYYEEKK